jgi:hypothetical protein
MATITLRANKGSPLTNNEVDANFNNLNTELGTKLAAADFTGANILTKIKTVDGALSGLDADTLDGYNQDTANTVNTIVRRDGSGDFAANEITANTFSGEFSGEAAITSGSITGITDITIADGGTGASTASGARTNLGLAIGTDVLAYSGTLDYMSGLAAAADQVPYFTGSTSASLFTVTSTARSLLDDTSTSAMRSTLGLSIGSNVQPYDADLSGLAGMSSDGIVVRTGNGTYANRTITASGGLVITNGSGVDGNINISSGQSIATTDNVRFNSLGIGTNASGTTGEIRATNQITAYYSDARLKENITKIDSALEKVESLSGVTYNANELAESFGFINKEQQVGVLAQEVKEVLPEAVKPAPFDIMLFEGTEISKSGQNYMTVQYEKLVPLLIEAVKELSAQVKELKESK